MARYIVKFMKDILGENGRHAEICQCSLEVDAADGREATEIAKRKFCESQRLQEWSLHADRVLVAETECPRT